MKQKIFLKLVNIYKLYRFPTTWFGAIWIDVSFLNKGLVVGQEKDVSLFLDRTGEPATQQQVSSRLKNKDTSFSQPTTHP